MCVRQCVPEWHFLHSEARSDDIAKGVFMINMPKTRRWQRAREDEKHSRYKQPSQLCSIRSSMHIDHNNVWWGEGGSH